MRVREKGRLAFCRNYPRMHTVGVDGLACTNASTLDLINQRPVISCGKYLTPHRSASSTRHTKGEGGRVVLFLAPREMKR